MLFKIIKLISATIKILKQQRHYADNGKVIENAKLTFDPIAPKKYAFCSDTAYHEAILPIIKMSMFCTTKQLSCNQKLGKKDITLHIQRSSYNCIKANVKQLILGHYSTRYENIDFFREEAAIFEVVLADDGKFEF
jgi:ribonuclease Z